jgi:hypothetical protein
MRMLDAQESRRFMHKKTGRMLIVLELSVNDFPSALL